MKAAIIPATVYSKIQSDYQVVERTQSNQASLFSDMAWIGQNRFIGLPVRMGIFTTRRSFPQPAYFYTLAGEAVLTLFVMCLTCVRKSQKKGRH